MDPTALPRGAEELLVDGLGETTVVIADDEPDAGEATLDEALHEGRPGAALVVARGQLQAEDAPLAAGGHAGGHERGHGHDPATVTDLQIRGVEPEVGMVLVSQ